MFCFCFFEVHLISRFDIWSSYSSRCLMVFCLTLSGGDLVILQVMSSRVYKICSEHFSIFSTEMWIAMLVTATVQVII